MDASGLATAHARYLERVAANVDEARQRWFEELHLAPGLTVLDAGCGLGLTTRQFAGRVGASGAAIGVDLSKELIERARTDSAEVANAHFHVADLANLPFDDCTFDAAYAERVFIHLAEPAVALGELLRVLRPGGRLLVIDPDHSQSVTDADDAELADMLTRCLGDEIVNWRSGRHLRSQMIVAGFSEVEVSAEVRMITDREVSRRIALRSPEQRLEKLIAAGAIDQSRADAYLADQDVRAADGRYQVAIVAYVVCGQAPLR